MVTNRISTREIPNRSINIALDGPQ